MTATTIRVQMAQRKDTAANWTAANPILLSGEIGYETDTKKFKIGDGTTNWNSLAYLPIPDGSGNLTITGNLEIGTTGSLTFEGSTADGFETTLTVTDPTADRTITLPNVSGTVVTTGDTGSVTSTMLADGTIVNADISGSAEIAVSKLANGTANQVIVTDGTNVSWSDNLTLAGDLTVNGTTTTINTENLLVEDKNIIIGNVATPTDLTADGGGITLKGATDKTINWVDATDAWTSSERFSYPLGSATAPALTFTGDPNTGIYSPGADQVSVATGGTERLRIDAAGQIEANGLGSAAAPAYSWIGDPNTGIYSPGADQVAISTNGTGRLFVDASGNVGVGATPSVRLDVRQNQAAYSYFDFYNTTAGGGIVWRQIVRNIADTGTSSIDFVKYLSGGFGIANNDTNAANFTAFNVGASERMRLDSSGRLGLGTSSPGYLMTVYNGSIFTGSAGNTINVPGIRIRERVAASGNPGSNYIECGEFVDIGNDGSGTDGNRFIVTNAGRVGIGTTSPSQLLTVSGGRISIDNAQAYSAKDSGGVDRNLLQINAGNSTLIGTAASSSRFLLEGTGTGEAARIDSSGRLLVGTSSSVNTFGVAPVFQVAGGEAYQSNIAYRADAFAPYISIGHSRSASVGTQTILQSGDDFGTFAFVGSDGTGFIRGATISAQVDGTPGANDMPGRLVFSTTADGASSPTERMRITSNGHLKASNNGTYLADGGTYHELYNTADSPTVEVTATNATYTKSSIEQNIHRTATTAYNFLRSYSGNFGDTEFILRGDGTGLCDGSWTGGGADYAEYFEWSDGNPDADDRRGIAVVLDGDKIRPALAGEDTIGVISGNPSVVGDSSWNKWNGKYLRDDYGTYIQEDYEVVNDEGETVVQQRRKLNPAYDPDVEYTSREERPEWDCVGLMGKLRIRKGQPTGSRWIKMRDISDSVEEWLVR
jgi:hypothetical protein